MTDSVYEEYETAAESLRGSTYRYLDDDIRSAVAEIPGHMGAFLGIEMPQSISGSDNGESRQLEATGEMVQRLAGWLAEHGHISADAAEHMAEQGRDARRELPEAERVGRMLTDFVASSPYGYHNLDPEDILDERMGDMSIRKVKDGSILVDDRDDVSVELAVPEELSDQIGGGRLVWTRLVRTESGWRLNQIGTVFR